MAMHHVSSGACCKINGGDSSAVNELPVVCKVSSREQNFLCPKCSQFFIYAQPAVTHIGKCSPETLLPCTWPKAVAKALPMASQAPKNQQVKREKKLGAALGSRATRAQPSLSDDGLEAIVREVECRLKCPVPTGSLYVNYCSLAIHPDELFKYRCANPKYRQTIAVPKSNQENMTEYLWARRQTKKLLGLLSISVPLVASSWYSLDMAARSCGIISNTTQTHLTFADGIRLPSPANSDSTDVYADWLSCSIHDVKLLQQALRSNPSCRIEVLHAVPRSIDNESMLVVADVSLLSYQVYEASERIRSKEVCALPQFSLHVAIGACSSQDKTRTLQLASNKLKGMELKVDPERMSALAPSLDQRLPEMMSSMHIDAKLVAATTAKQPNDAGAFGDAVRMAMAAALEINFGLVQK